MINKNLEIWEDIFCNNEWGKYPPISVIKFIAKNYYKVSNRKEIKILEIGSGTGANLWYIAREGFTVYAIDGSETACERFNKRMMDEKLDHMIGDIKVGDYHTMLHDFDDNFFDAIIDVESLYCNSFNKSKEIIQTAFSKLKKNGMLFSMTFCEGTYGVCGDEIDYHAVLPKTGPMAEKGFTRYVSRTDIDKLYKLENNIITKIEMQELHLENNESIKEWLIELKKV